MPRMRLLLLPLAAAAAVMPARGACSPDGLALAVARGDLGAVELSWAGADPGFEVFRSPDAASVLDPGHSLGQTQGRTWSDTPPPGAIWFYRVSSLSVKREITFAARGVRGDFDLATVPDRGPEGELHVSYSYVGEDAGRTAVTSHLGRVDPARPRCVQFVAALNDLEPVDDPLEGPLLFHHETSTLARDPDSGKWVLFWHTYPLDASDARRFEYGWIARKRIDDDPLAPGRPDPSTLDAKETRLFRGLGYNGRLEPATAGWASGGPIDPVPGNVKYVAYTEPGAFYDGSLLYLALAGSFCPSDCFSDVLLLRSPDDGETWEFVGVLLQPRDASAFDPAFRFFTAPAIHRDPGDGSVRLIVTPSNVFNQYQGLYEFEFENLAAGRLRRDATGRPIPRFTIRPESPTTFTGAGAFLPQSSRRGLGKFFPGEPEGFRFFEYAP